MNWVGGLSSNVSYKTGWIQMDFFSGISLNTEAFFTEGGFIKPWNWRFWSVGWNKTNVCVYIFSE